MAYVTVHEISLVVSASRSAECIHHTTVPWPNLWLLIFLAIRAFVTICVSVRYVIRRALTLIELIEKGCTNIAELDAALTGHMVASVNLLNHGVARRT